MEHQLRERKGVQIAWTSNRVPEVLSDLILNSRNLVPGHLVSSFQNTTCREESHRVITYDREPVPWGKIETTYISQVEESKRQKIQLQALAKLSLSVLSSYLVFDPAIRFKLTTVSGFSSRTR